MVDHRIDEVELVIVGTLFREVTVLERKLTKGTKINRDDWPP